jgi:hypothetical protein
VIPDWKPQPRVVDKKAQPLDATPLRTGECPLCHRRHVTLSRHHVVPKGQGGDDLPQNLVWVCGHGTVGCHGVLTHRNRDGESGLTYDEVAERLLRYLSRQSMEAVRAYAARKKYDGYLADYYGVPEAA